MYKLDILSLLMLVTYVTGHAVAQLDEALRYKVAGSIPDVFTGIFHFHSFLPAAVWPCG